MEHTWQDFALAEPELAAFGEQRFKSGPAYLATVRPDGMPRVHPVTPIIAEGHLLLFMEPTSPKGYDLRRSGAYTLHCGVSDGSGQSGEFLVRGRAALVRDAETRALAAASAGYAPAERYILFDLDVDGAAGVTYDDGRPQHRRWGAV